MTPESEPLPHEILGIPPDADQETIRHAYRQLIKQHRPERDPKGFERIRRAYESMRQRAAPEQASTPDPKREPDSPAESTERDALPDDDASLAVPDSIDELLESWSKDGASEPALEAETEASETKEADQHSGQVSSRDFVLGATPDDPDAPEEMVLSVAEFGELLERVRVAPDREAAFAVLDRHWGDHRFRRPDEIVILSMTAAESISPPQAVVELLVAWLGTLDHEQDWALDRLDELQLGQRLGELAEAAVADGIPEALAHLLRDHSGMSMDELRKFGKTRMPEMFSSPRSQRRCLRRLRRRHAALWNSWGVLRGRLVTATAEVRLVGDRSLDRETARTRSAELMRTMDKKIDDASDLPMVLGLIAAFSLVTLAFRFGTSWLVLLSILAGVAVAGCSIQYGWARAFDRYVEPTLRKRLPPAGLAVADIVAVLVEQPKATKHWDEVQADLERTIPIWLETL